MKKEGGCEWYQSMGHIFLYISANFLLFFKGPWPFKSQKTHFSGLTTQYAPRLNLGPFAAKKHHSGWVIAWIFLDSGRNLLRSRIICMLYSFQFSWIFDHSYSAPSLKKSAKHCTLFFLRIWDTYSQMKTYEVPTRYRADTGEDMVKSA
jgi:hypothetical protein